MSRSFLLGILLCCASFGCAVGEDDTPRIVVINSPDARAVDSSVELDATAEDSAEVVDSTVADTTVAADSETTDTGAVDTTFVDTALADTALGDTAVVDTASPDTGTPDTAPVDTGTPDTGAPDTGMTCAVRGCTTGTETRSGCANARTIGRTVAATTTGYKISDDLCTASNKFDESGSSCWDANADHAYKIWMMAGETINVSLSTSWPCNIDLFSWYATLKIIENAGCDDTACTTRTYCAYNKLSQTKAFTAPRDGWYILVVEGSSAFDDEGDYTFTVKLTCKTTDCGC